MIKSWINEKFLDLAYEDRAYKAGFIFFYTYLLIGAFVLLIFGQKALNIIASVSIYPIALTFTVAVVIEFWKLIVTVLENKYFKWISAGLVFIVYKFSAIKAGEVTHKVTSYDPGAFSQATSLLTVFYLPYAWFWLAFSILVLLILFWWLLFPAKEINNNNHFGRAKSLGRLVGIFVVFIFTIKATDFYEDQNSIPFKFAKHIILISEYHPNIYCTNFNDNIYISDIGNGYVSRYNGQSKEFDIYPCDFGVIKQ